MTEAQNVLFLRLSILWDQSNAGAVLIQADAFSVVVKEWSLRNQYFAQLDTDFIYLTGFEVETLNCYWYTII
jgi:hypothetical protein